MRWTAEVEENVDALLRNPFDAHRERFKNAVVWANETLAEPRALLERLLKLGDDESYGRIRRLVFAFGHFVAGLDVDAFHHAGSAGRQIHGGFVCFHHRQGLLHGHHVAGLNQYFDDVDFRHVADIGDFYFD